MKYYLSLLIFLLFFVGACKETDSEKSERNQDSINVFLSLDSVEFVKLWETDTLLTTAESVIYDEERAVFYVACINGVSPWIHDGDGFIAKIDLEGNILSRKWVEGISGPKGMGIIGDDLYVTDINQVVRINIDSAKIVERIPIEGGQNINDLTVAHDGDVFVSDSKAASIYKISEGKVDLLLRDSTFKGINGVYMLDDTLFFATYNEGKVYRIEHGDLEPRELISLPSGGDGVEKFHDGFIISSWEGRVYAIDNEWKFREIMNTTNSRINSADIEVVEDKNLLLIPTFFDNRVVAYKINF